MIFERAHTIRNAYEALSVAHTDAVQHGLPKALCDALLDALQACGEAIDIAIALCE